MMCSKVFLVFAVIFLSSRCICALEIIDSNDHRKTLFEESKWCIPKCCEKGQFYNSTLRKCIDSEKELDPNRFNDLPVYEAYDNRTSNETFKKLMDKKLGDIWPYLVAGRMDEEIFNGTTFSENFHFLPKKNGFPSYLTQTGELYIKTTKLYLVHFFCVEYVTSSSEEEAKPEIIVSVLEVSKSTDYKGIIIYYSLIISSIFLVLVLLVYIILPELRNLGGMILMAYVASLLLVFILLVKMQVVSFRPSTCIYITAVVYFGTLSAFCWLNVMSVDIWWTFRGYAKARPIHRRGENFKFCMYCLYGWGLPVIMTIGLVVVNETDLSQWPWIITPDIPEQGCFLRGKIQNLYMYTPMTILIVSNWMFFVMTAYNIRRLMRGTAILNSDSTAAGNPSAHRREKIRFILYLKLSVIMGINWLFEMLSVIEPDLLVWKISDFYNSITGVAIFLIFVFKRKIYYKLKLRFNVLLSCAKSRSTQITTGRKFSDSNSQSTKSKFSLDNFSSKK